MEKSKRPKAKCDDGVDLISTLPDAVLLLILSGLSSTEEVIRTCILSTRWRHLWTSIPSLNMFYPQWQAPHKFKRKKEFKEFVYWVLLNRSADLDVFRLSCSNFYDTSTVERWIYAAVKRNVKQLYLSFRPKDQTEYIKMPHCLVTCGSLEELNLYFFRTRLRLPNFTGFPALRVLELSGVELFEDDSVEKFLENCPMLEELTLLGCLTNNLNLLCISCPMLKKLIIDNEKEDDYENEGVYGALKISCPKLDFLNLAGDRTHIFLFERLDSLKEAVIEPKGLPPAPELMGNSIGLWFAQVSHVESLFIDFYFFVQCINAARDPALPNLKTLVLPTTTNAFTADEFIRILKYYPKLESLSLKINEESFVYEELNEAEAMEIFMTPDLKRVELLEFNGEKPKLVIQWIELTLVEIEFSWGKKSPGCTQL